MFHCGNTTQWVGHFKSMPTPNISWTLTMSFCRSIQTNLLRRPSGPSFWQGQSSHGDGEVARHRPRHTHIYIYIYTYYHIIYHCIVSVWVSVSVSASPYRDRYSYRYQYECMYHYQYTYISIYRYINLTKPYIYI